MFIIIYESSYAKETPRMKAAHEKLRQKHFAHPEAERSYTHTKAGKAANEDQRKKAEDQMKKNNEALDKLRKGRVHLAQ